MYLEVRALIRLLNLTSNFYESNILLKETKEEIYHGTEHTNKATSL